MRQTSGGGYRSSERIVKDIKRAARKPYSSEEKIRIVSSGLLGEDSIAELCRCKVVKLALKETELSPRELVVTFTDAKKVLYVSSFGLSISRQCTRSMHEKGVLKAAPLIDCFAINCRAVSEFKDKATVISQLLLSGM